MSDSLIRSFLVSEMSYLLTSLISSERPEQIAQGHSFLVSDVSKLSDSLTSLTKKVEMSKNKRFGHFFGKKNLNKT